MTLINKVRIRAMYSDRLVPTDPPQYKTLKVNPYQCNFNDIAFRLANHLPNLYEVMNPDDDIYFRIKEYPSMRGKRIFWQGFHKHVLRVTVQTLEEAIELLTYTPAEFLRYARQLGANLEMME